MRRPFLALMVTAATPAGATGMIAPLALQAQVEAFAGQPALVDPRLLLPACRRPAMAFAAGGRSVVVDCPAPVWRVFIPVGSAVAAAPPAAAPPLQYGSDPSAPPAIRRGDRVTVEVDGAGFSVGMEAVAEADARDGRVSLRPLNGGRRLVGFIGDDGRVTIRGLNAMVNGR